MLWMAMLTVMPAFAQTSHWALKAGGATVDEATDISMDAAGNAYTTGYFTGNASFGSQSLAANGITDIYLAKANPQGVFEWAVKAGGNAADRALGIKTDGQGNSYVTGFFQGTATFGGQTLVSSGLQDVFIAKYNASGVVQWAVKAGGTLSDIGNGINVDQAGNVVVTGEFAGSATFGATTLTSMNGSVDVFVAKLNADGVFQWAKKGSAPAIDRGIDVACDAQGNVYVAGQFSDTITFDVTHQNNMVNAVFVIKYNSNGQEQWFRKMGGGALNIVTGIVVDNASNVLITGDFTGNAIFFGTPSTTLTSSYANRIFVAKYATSGVLQWAVASGSDNAITSKNIALDSQGNACVVGNFRCVLSEFSNQYGEGTFNSVGFWDVFVAKYSASGQWMFSRNVGGRQSDNGAGIAVNAFGQMHIAGSFSEQLNFPVPEDFIDPGTPPLTTGGVYCNDDEYRIYRSLASSGNLDAFILNVFDPLRAPYDYYVRPNIAGCDVSYLGVCLGANACPDSLDACGFAIIPAVSNTTLAGPAFTYLWANNTTAPSIPGISTGNYSVTMTSIDGCFVSQDTVHLTINPLPPQPLITDSYGINVQAAITVPIIICGDDSVLLSAINYDQNMFGWSGPQSTNNNDSVWATVAGAYGFYTQDANGCLRSSVVQVIMDDDFPPLPAGMIGVQDHDRNDTITICTGANFSMLVYDTIANPNAVLACIPAAEIFWTVTPSSTISFGSPTVCLVYSENTFTVTASGDYTITAMVVRENYCFADTVYVTRTIHIELLPVPILPPLTISISGNPGLCPGDTIVLTASPAPNYEWGGPDIQSAASSITVFQPGTYTVVTTLTDTNEYGCISVSSAQASHTLVASLQPVVTMLPGNGLICPNGSIVLSCSGAGVFSWQGPDGPFGGNSASITVNSPGQYYCVRSDQYGCQLVSNTVIINQYTTPFIIPFPSSMVCEGESVTLSVNSNPESTIEWLAPLQGNVWEQTVSEAGTYSCMVTSCGITSEVSIAIAVSNVVAGIEVVGAATFCEGDSVTLVAVAGANSFVWQPEGSSSPTLTLHASGEHTLLAFDANGCSGSFGPVQVTAIANTLQPPVLADTAVCPQGQAVLHAIAGGLVRWYDGAEGGLSIASGPAYTTPPLEVAATYFASQQSAYCESERAPVLVLMDNCEGIDMPNAFSPNGDGVNDVFSFGLKGAKCFRCDIYSRWGRLLYAWEDAAAGWDGTLQRTGERVTDGVYYWVMDYCDYLGNAKRGAGYVHVLGQ